MSKVAILSSTDAVEAVALAASDLAKRAQPHTAASRLTLRDLKDVISYLSLAAHALGDGIEDRWALLLPPGSWSVCRQAGAKVNFAAGYLDDAENAAARDLHMLHVRDPGNLDGQQTRGRRWLVCAADLFRAQCAYLCSGNGELGDARPELLRGTCAQFSAAVGHVAILTDAACERALGRTSQTLTPLIGARVELEAARRLADVLCAAMQ